MTPRVLVVAPSIVVRNWLHEVRRLLPKTEGQQLMGRVIDAATYVCALCLSRPV